MHHPLHTSYSIATSITVKSNYHDYNTPCSSTSFFPSLPIVHGKSNYKMGSNSPTQDDNCRKASYSHPIPAPGIFTVYCPHRVCYGFEVMQGCESPKVPFDIFTSRFHSPPKVIIYDNACKLHTYCSNH